MYPSIPFLNRECTKDYKIPNSNIILKKNTNVLISNLGIQRDPEYYHKPNIFNPDRFSTENIKTRPPYTYLPFGEGPRNCIGMRHIYKLLHPIIWTTTNMFVKVKLGTKYINQFFLLFVT